MEYKEKWLSLKEDIENVVNCGLECIGELDIKNQNRLIAYRNILDCMNELDSNEKTTQNSNKEIDEILDEILDDLIYELLVNLSKEQILETD